jgi:hypothetical protein
MEKSNETCKRHCTNSEGRRHRERQGAFLPRLRHQGAPPRRSATVFIKGITLQVLREDDDTGLQETTWRYDPAALARLRSERKQADEAPDKELSHPAVTWKEWAGDIINAIRNGPEDRRATAVATLRKLTDYLDEQYDSGYHGIAAMPLAECNMGWDW